MKSPPPYPLKFHPVYKDYIWGGSRISETFQRNLPPGICAESWEIADHPDGMSVVANGPLAGKTLRGILREAPKEIMGTRTKGDRFPLLIKLIDARQRLSVQVHPNDRTAPVVGGEAKTEMWYLLGDNPAQVYCGLREGTTRESFLRAVENGTCGETLRTVPVQKDSAVFVPGGRVHAIDAGCLILEIQQNSNTTYRIFDWNRVGTDGKPRELHIEKAMQVIDWSDRGNPLAKPRLLAESETFQHWEILSCDYFRLEKLSGFQSLEIPMDGKTFHALFVAEGKAEISWANGREHIAAGESILIPAALPAYTLEGPATILRTTIP